MLAVNIVFVVQGRWCLIFICVSLFFLLLQMSTKYRADLNATTMLGQAKTVIQVKHWNKWFKNESSSFLDINLGKLSTNFTYQILCKELIWYRLTFKIVSILWKFKYRTQTQTKFHVLKICNHIKYFLINKVNFVLQFLGWNRCRRRADRLPQVQLLLREGSDEVSAHQRKTRSHSQFGNKAGYYCF